MLNRLVASFALVIMAALPANAQDAPDPRAVLQAASAAMGAGEVRSLRYSGHGYVTSPGQAYSSALNDTWPRYDMRYTRTIDYTTNSYMDEQTRNQATWPNCGGGGRPTSGDRSLKEFYADEFAWDESNGGDPASDPRDIVIRKMEVLLTPHGFIKAALAAPDATAHRQIASSRSIQHV
ncbi:MAG: hypothetical protein V3S07_03670, partial [Micropepsaceae bacterium]